MDVETTRSGDDLKLIERYLSGDEFAVEELVKKYQRKIYSLAFRMTNNVEDSKDMTQKTFLQAIKNLKGFRRESTFHTWLYQIAYNTCLNHLRKKESKTIEVNDTIPSQSEGALSRAINKEKKTHLRESLEKLPLRQKTAITLRVYEDLSVKETARIMSLSEGAVKAHYHHGMKKLREVLKKRGYEIES
ncbi:RNA polymerase sigma factor [bacterium]|nr:MAG: RNA polymerase sigma factor [bacterium]